MKISELTSLLQKVTQLAGDVEIVLQHAADEVETVITDLAIHLTPSTGTAGSTVVVTHDTAPPPPEPEPAAEPAAPADVPSDTPADS